MKLLVRFAVLLTISVLAVGCPSKKGGGGDDDDDDDGVTIAITSIAPAYAAQGATITVTGTSFGATEGELLLDGVVADVTTWTDTVITATVPALALGDTDVVATPDGGTPSAAYPFEVTLPSRLYVNDGLGAVQAFSFAANGALTALAGSPFSTGGIGGSGGHGGDAHALALDHVRGRLYAQGPSGVAAFDIDRVDGTLTALPVLVVGTSNLPIALTQDASHLFFGNCNDASSFVGTLAVTTAGAMSYLGSEPAAGCHDSAVLSHDDALLLLNDEGDAETHVFAVSDGDLTEVAGSPFASNGGYAIQIHPTQNWIYNGEASLYAYELETNGTLTPIAGSPYAVSPGVSGLAFTRDGSRLYVSGFTNTDVACFDVNPTTGALTAGPVATGALTGEGQVAVTTRDGRLVVGTNVGDLSVFTIGSGGALSAVAGSPFILDGDANPVGLLATP